MFLPLCVCARFYSMERVWVPIERKCTAQIQAHGSTQKRIVCYQGSEKNDGIKEKPGRQYAEQYQQKKTFFFKFLWEFSEKSW